MWKKTSWSSFKESDHEATIAENLAATTNGYEAPGSLLHGSKRQRRPSVRLGEIGEQPAASLTEKRRKSIYVLSPTQTNHSRLGDSTVALEKNETLQSIADNYKAAKSLKKSPNLNSNSNENVTTGEGDEAVKYSFKASDVSSPCWPDLRSVSPGTASQKTHNGLVKGFSKKGRNGNRKSGELKTSTCENLSIVVRSPNLTANNADDKVKCLEIKDAHRSDDENDARTPEGFRDCDLDESDNHTDSRDASNSQDSRPLRSENLSLVKFIKQHEPSTKVSGEYLLEDGDQGFDKNKPKTMKGDSRSRKINKRRSSEPSNRVVVRAASEGNRCIDDLKAKTILDADRNHVATDPTRDFGVHSHLTNGVQGWLQDLGLGKYAQHFEAHEVDPEVLPLLTIEDLKEMGITAVGSRRKMFYSIQQLAKCLLVKTDKTPVFGP